MKQKLNRFLFCLTLCTLCLAGLASCADDETLSAGIGGEEGELVIRCLVTDPVVSSNRATRATPDALGTETERAICSLDLLVFNGESCIRHMTTKRASDVATGKSFTTSTSGGATWYVTNCVPKNYLSNANYTHVLIANLPDAGKDLSSMTLAEVKNYFLRNENFNPYAEQTAGIPMIQILPAANPSYEGDETVRTEFVGTQLNFNALERTVAKVQVVTQDVSSGVYLSAGTVDFEDEDTYLDGFSLQEGIICVWAPYSNEVGAGHYVQLTNPYGQNKDYSVTYRLSAPMSADWKLTFDFNCSPSNQNQSRLTAVSPSGATIFYLTFGNSQTTTDVTVYDANGNALGTFKSANRNLDASAVSLNDESWVRFTLSAGTTHGTHLSAVKVSNNEEIVPDTHIGNFHHLDRLEMTIGRSCTKMGFDNLSFSYRSSLPGIISGYKLVNYLKDGWLYNNEANTDYAFDKRCDDPTVRPFQNAFDQGRVNLEDFNPWGENPTMQGNNGFAVYCYPNYWFDNAAYAEKKEGMHKYQPILEDRQTYLLVKARYVEPTTGVLSAKAYYYKVPVSQRLPEWNDAYTNGDLISNDLCKVFIDAVETLFNAGKHSVDELTDDERTTLYTTFETQLAKSTYPVYTHSDGTKLTDDEKTELHRAVADEIFGIYAEAQTTGTTPDKNNTIAPAVRAIILNERVRVETETYCRIRRNHHYIVYASFDHAGGETEDEAFYLATEPFYDVVLRPEF